LLDLSKRLGFKGLSIRAPDKFFLMLAAVSLKEE